MSLWSWLLMLGLSLPQPGFAESPPIPEDPYVFNDFPLKEPIEYPDWFKRSFLDLQEDLKEALAGGKQGLLVYFGQANCAYCQRLLEVNFGLPDVRDYTQRHFDVVPLDVLGPEEVTDLEGRVLSARDLAQRERTTFTPSLIFYGPQGRELFRLQGYYPPYPFRAALEYVADRHYLREPFVDYLARGEDAPKFEPGDLHEEPFLTPPPHALDRSRQPGERPLVVFFEQGDCHACDVLHGGPLRDPDVRRALERFDAVQLDLWADTPVITPTGQATSARAWARALGLFYAPSLLFFDERGREILRVDSVAGFYRLRNALAYVESGAFRREPSFLRWRIQGGH